MSTQFHNIGIIAKLQNPEVLETLQETVSYLQSKELNLYLEKETAKSAKKIKLPVKTDEQLGKICDLFVVIGGDGSLLNAARNVVQYNIPMIGINRGKLGFLTDIKPHDIVSKINDILEGKFYEEERFLLEVTVKSNKKIHQCSALNEIILTSAHTARMIEFETFIDNKFMCSQRSDGMIIATPTGSTAYALSAGGPILYPHLDAIALIPMFPHTLSSRPIVINGDKRINLSICDHGENEARIHCDAQLVFDVQNGDEITIVKKNQPLRLIHPLDYNYYETLRSKLGWGQRIS